MNLLTDIPELRDFGGLWEIQAASLLPSRKTQSFLSSYIVESSISMVWVSIPILGVSGPANQDRIVTS